jgi:hypothetical protein
MIRPRKGPFKESVVNFQTACLEVRTPGAMRAQACFIGVDRGVGAMALI